MTQITITLEKGIAIGTETDPNRKVHREAVLREANALDVIQATADSEKVVMVPAGIDVHGRPVLVAQLIASPTMVGVNVLRRQLIRIGDILGPIDDVYFEKLSPGDLNRLQSAIDSLEHASAEVAQRGRFDSPSGDPT